MVVSMSTKPLTSPHRFDTLPAVDIADLLAPFNPCQTVRATNEVYHQLYDQLQEAHRRAMERVIHGGAVPKSESAHSNSGETRVRPTQLRSWAMRQGIPLARKGRVSAEIENQYRLAHDLPTLTVAPRQASLEDAGVSVGEVRSWAQSAGVEVGSRGRIHPEVIAQYIATHQEA